MAPHSGESTRENFTHSGSKASRKDTLSTPYKQGNEDPGELYDCVPV